MARYTNDNPESSDPFAACDGERWGIADGASLWTDAEQWAREQLDCESFPLPEEFDLCPSGLHKMGSCGCDGETVYDEDCPF